MTTYTTPVPPEHHAPSAAPSRVGQATAVEQSRATAEVQAAIVVAQQFPRDVRAADAAMRESCSILGFAERAFYRYPRGGQTVSGASVHLARELARCWGNIDYGIAEMRRDDEAAQSEMRAWAWDQQTNARSSITFIVPHKRDKKARRGEDRSPELLIDLRDIYENNANMGARRLREAVFSILPRWFVDEAERACQDTIERGDGRPLPERRARAAELLGEMGVSVDRIELKLGKAADSWTPYELGKLATIYQSVRRGEVSVDDEFPQPAVSVVEVQDGASEAPEPGQAPTSAEPAAEGATLPQPVNVAEFASMVRARDAMVAAVQQRFEDRAGDLSTLEGIYADPEALDYAMSIIENGGRA